MALPFVFASVQFCNRWPNGFAMKITEMVAVIRANIKGFEVGMMRAQMLTDGLGSKFANVARSIDTAATRIGASVAVMGVGLATTFGKFELIMKRAGAVTNSLGTRDFARLEHAAKEMGRTTVFSASQAAVAIEQMGLAGLSVDEIITALPGALQLASSAQVDIAKAADISAKALRGFGADASELAHINDVLVATFTRSNTDITMLGEAMKHVAPVSNALGVSVEDTSAVLAKLGDAGFQGSIAGTSFRNVLSRLAGAMPELKAKFEELGITTLDSSGNMLPFLDILEQIEKQGLTDAKILELFGARGGPQMLALLEVGSGAIRDFSGQLAQAGGTAQRISDANLDSLWGMMMLIISAAENVAIELGQRLAPTIRVLGAQLTSFIETSTPGMVALGEIVFKQLVEAFTALFALLQTHGPTMLQAAQGWWALVSPILKFLAVHPEVIAAFAAFKTGQVLGVNQVFMSMGGLVLQLITNFGTLTKSVGLLQAAMTSLGAIQAGGFIALIALISYKLYNANKDVIKFREEIEKTRKLSEEMSSVRERRENRFMADAQSLPASSRKDVLAEELGRAMQELAGASASRKGAQKNFDATNTTYNSVMAPFDVSMSQQELTEAKTREQEAQAWVDRLRSEMGMAEAELKTQAQGAGVVMGQAAAQQIAEQIGLNTGVGLAGSDPYSSGGSLGGEEQLSEADQFRQQLAAEDEARKQRMLTLYQQLAELERQRNEALAQGNAQMQQASLNLREQYAGLSGVDSIVANMNSRFGDLQNQLKAGAISVEQFNEKVGETADAASRAAAAEHRKKVIAGDFAGAGLSVQQALEDRAFNMRMQQFNSGVDQLFNQMMGLGNGFQGVSQNLRGFGQQLRDTAQGMQVASGEQAAQMSAQIAALFNSIGGQIALVQNNIALALQRMQFADTYQKQKQIQDELNAMYAELNALTTAPPPMLVASANISNDPVLAAQQGGNTVVNLELPNINRFTSQDSRVLTDIVVQELNRRGRNILG
jgi:TP901 family phage tail tape measure protein